MLTNLFFISDTVGNLIAFSDGTFSGETADHDEVEMEELPKKTVSIISMITAPEPLRYQNRPDRKCRNPCQSLSCYRRLYNFSHFLALSRGGLSGSSGLGSSLGRGHCVVFLGKTLNSHSASLHPGV